MGWETDLLDATIDGVPFECLSEKSKRDYILAVYQSPFSNGAKIVPMGADPEDISLNAILSGDDYKSQLDALLEVLDRIGVKELIHPIYGIKRVYATSREVDHSPELVDGCILTMSFKAEPVESFGALFSPIPNSNADRLEALVLSIPTARLQQYVDKSPFISALTSLAEVSDMIRTGVNRVHRAIGIVTSTVDDFTSPPDWIAGLLADVTGLTDGFLPGEGSLAAWRAIASKVRSMDDYFTATSSISTPLPEPLKQVSRSMVVGCMIASAQSVIAGEVDNPKLTPTELSQICADVRTAIQVAIAAERTEAAQVRVSGVQPVIPTQTAKQISALKQSAATIQAQFQALIERRPPFVTRQVPLLCCTRWLAHRLYGDHARAREMVRLNPQVANPALIYAGMTVNAYAQ